MVMTTEQCGMVKEITAYTKGDKIICYTSN